MSRQWPSVQGQPAPGTRSASEFAEQLRSNGINVIGEELEVKGPVGARRYDIVVQGEDGRLHGIEVKSGGATKTPYQRFTDQFINIFGAEGTGRIKGQRVESATTVFLPKRDS